MAPPFGTLYAAEANPRIRKVRVFCNPALIRAPPNTRSFSNHSGSNLPLPPPLFSIHYVLGYI